MIFRLRKSIYSFSIIIALSATSILNAQNLATDPSFELIGCVGELPGGITNSWFPTGGSADVYCISPRTGQNHGGIFVYVYNGKHEYLQNKLNTPLIAGKNYYVEMYIKLSQPSKVAIGEFGFYFSVGPYIATSGLGLTVTPQVTQSNATGFTDQANYTKISGCYLAQGGEDHVVLGNFKTNANVVITTLPGYTGSNNDFGYYYIDDFLVEYADVSIDFGPDKNLCPAKDTLLEVQQQNNCSYLWQDGSTSSSYSAITSGIYWVEITTQCAVKLDTINIQFTDDCINNIFVPTAFSPDEDGTNDVFEIKGMNLKNLDVKIFDRWGNMIYSSSSASISWDGKKDNIPVSSGIYKCLVDCEWNNGETDRIAKELAIIR